MILPELHTIGFYAEVEVLLDGLPERILHEMRERHVTTREAAAEIGLSQATLSKFTSRRRGIHLDSAIKILRWLGEG